MGTTGPTAQALGQAQQRNDETEVWLILFRNFLLALGVGLGGVAYERCDRQP